MNLLAPDLIEENIEAIAEAIQSYGKRKAPALEVELWVRLGKLYASLGRKPDANEAWMSAQVAAAPLTKQVLCFCFICCIIDFHILPFLL